MAFTRESPASTVRTNDTGYFPGWNVKRNVPEHLHIAITRLHAADAEQRLRDGKVSEAAGRSRSCGLHLRQDRSIGVKTLTRNQTKIRAQQALGKHLGAFVIT